MSKREDIEDLKKRLYKVEKALKFPSLASEEGFSRFERLVNTEDDKVHSLWGRVNRLLDYLGLEDVTTPPTTIIRKKENPAKSKSDNKYDII